MTTTSTYPTCNALLFMLSRRTNYRPIIISHNEVFCGPDCDTTETSGAIHTLKTPAGIYDCNDIHAILPAKQTPELIVVKADGTQRNFPINLKVFNCPKILIVGNTQHLIKPLQTLLHYAIQEKFDCIVSDHKGHHLHYFLEAGFKNVGFIPALNINPFPQPWQEQTEFDISFVGQIGKLHPYRNYILNSLHRDNIHIHKFQTSQEKAASIYAKSLINLNISLNGDMNLRIFEVLASGGFLVTDKLTAESGLFNFFTENQHFVMFNDYEDLKEKIAYYLSTPEAARDIARNGLKQFSTNHKPEVKAHALADFGLTQVLDEKYSLQYDKRCRKIRNTPGQDLLNRVSEYEIVQELHLHSPKLTILFGPDVGQDLITDISDLPRIQLIFNDILQPPQDAPFKNNYSTNIQFNFLSQNTSPYYSVDLVIISQSTFLKFDIEHFLLTVNFSHLLITGCNGDTIFSTDHEYNQLLKNLGFSQIMDHPPYYSWSDKNKWGEYLVNQGKITEATNHFKRTLITEPHNADTLNNLGVVLFQKGDLLRAESLFIQALSLNRRNENYLANYAVVLFEQEKYDKAIKIYKEILSIQGEDAETYYRLAICYQKEALYQDALETIKLALALQPVNQEYQKWFSDHSERLKKIAKSVGKHKNIVTLSYPQQRILIINNLFPPQSLGGYGRLLYDFASLLSIRGHDTYVLTSDSKYLGQAPEHEPGIDRRLQLLGEWREGKALPIVDPLEVEKKTAQNINIIESVFRTFNPSCVLVGDIGFFHLDILYICISYNIPLIHHVGNSTPGYAPDQTPSASNYHLATASNWLKQHLQNNHYYPRHISTIYPRARVKEFTFEVSPCQDRLRIAYASIMLPYKGPHILLHALLKLHNKGVDFRCELAGTSTDSDFVGSLKSFVHTNNLDDKIKFLGMLGRKELKDLFGRSNILAFPSVFQEPFGISQVEAMAAGLVVITSGTGGTKEITEHQISGLHFESENADALANQIIYLHNNPDTWRRIAFTGQKKAQDLFDIATSIDEIECLFSNMQNSL